MALDHDESWLRELAQQLSSTKHSCFDIDDLVQEGRIALWKLSQTTPDAHINLRVLRARSAMVEFVAMNTDCPLPFAADGQQPTPEAVVELQEVVAQACRSMPSNMREVFEHALAGISEAQIAKVLELSINRVQQLLSRARAELQPYLSEVHPEDHLWVLYLAERMGGG